MIAPDQFIKMVGLLQQSTEKNLLEWKRDNNGLFFTIINGCRVDIESYFDTDFRDSAIKVRFFNVDGRIFNTSYYTKKVDVKEYELLSRLHDTIRDRYYKVTESEQLIFNGLNDILNGKGE